MLSRRAFVIGAPAALAACSAESIWANDADVAAFRYVSGRPPSLRLYTVRNRQSGNGAHSALLIDGAERVLFDPAGSFKASGVPERNDVLHGFTPAAEQAYRSYHSRTQYDVIWQTVAVSPDVAAQALRLAQANGAVPQAGCARATSGILRQLPGFQAINRTWFPDILEQAFATLPGVTTDILSEND